MKSTKQSLKENKLVIPQKLEMALILGLLNWKPESNGWKRMREITDAQEYESNIVDDGHKNKNYNPFWVKHGKYDTNFPKIIKKLEKNGVVEKDSKKVDKNKYRSAYPYIWRLKQTPENFASIKNWCWIWDVINQENQEEQQPNLVTFFDKSDYSKNQPALEKEYYEKYFQPQMRQSLKKTKTELLKRYKESVLNMLIMEFHLKLARIYRTDIRQSTIDVIEKESILLKNHNQPQNKQMNNEKFNNCYQGK